MAEQIITKRCSHCKQIKSIIEFRKNKSAKDGLHNQCKVCEYEYRISDRGKKSHNAWDKKYRQTERGKASARSRQKKWRNSTKGKKYCYDYNRSSQYKISHKKYVLAEKGKTNKYKQCRKNYKKFPNKNKARDAVKYAVKTGKLPNVKSLQCSYCSEQANVYHHHKGYDKASQLIVEPVCYICHKKIHSNGLSGRAEPLSP